MNIPSKYRQIASVAALALMAWSGRSARADDLTFLSFSGYASADDETWNPVGAPVTVEMNPEILTGMAVTAGNRDGSKLHTATFEQVSVSGNTEGP